MLTVKHVKPSGCESIHLAREVRYDCGQGPESIASAPTLWIDTPSGETQGLGSWGVFYVMNDAGKTVARYNMGGWPDSKEAGPIVPVVEDQFPPERHPGAGMSLGAI